MATTDSRRMVWSVLLGLLLFMGWSMLLCPTEGMCQEKPSASQEEKEAQVHADFNKAIALYNQGKLEPARNLFMKVKNSGVYLGFFKNRDLHNYLARIDEQLRKPPADRVEEMQTKYEQAKGLFEEGRYLEAKRMFQAIAASKVNLGFFKNRQLKNYLAQVDEKIAQQKREGGAPIAKPPKTTPRAEPTPAPKKMVKKPQKPPTPDMLAEAKKRQMTDLYEKGKQFYDDERWSDAKDCLQQVANSGVDLGWWRNRSLRSMLLNAKRRAEEAAMKRARAPEPTPDRKKELMGKFSEAEALYKAGKYDDSALLYQEIKSANVDLGADVNRAVNTHMQKALAESQAERAAALGSDEEASRLLSKMRMERRVIEQKNQSLAEHYANVGEKFYNEQEYQKAKEQLEKALRLVPDYAKARDLLQRTNAALDLPKERFKTAADRLAEEKAVQIQQKKFEMENKLREGVALLKANRYDDALAAFDLCTIMINRLRRDVDVTAYEDHLESLIELATRRREEQNITMEKVRKREAAKQAAQDEDRQNDLTEQKIQTMYEQAYSAFLKERYEDVVQTCRDILDEDPKNAAVEELMERAKIEQEKQTWRDIRKMDIDEHEKNRQYLTDAALPRTDIEGFPKKEVWERISQREPVSFPEITSDLSENERNLEKALDEQRVDISFESTPILDVVNFLRTLVDKNIALDSQVPEDTTITLELRNVSLRAALDNICMLGEGLAYTIRNEAIWITTKEAMAGDMVVLVYDVRDLLLAVIDRPRRPNILGEGPSSGGEGGGGLDFGGGGGGGSGGILRDSRGRDMMDIELQTRGKELVKLIIKITGVDSWQAMPAYIVPHLPKGDDDDFSEDIEGGEGMGTIAFRDGDLIVKQTKDVHEQIRQLLSRMRDSLYLQVQIDCRFLTVTDDFLEEIGTDITDLLIRSDGRQMLNPQTGAGTWNTNPQWQNTTQWANRWQRPYMLDPQLQGTVANGNLFALSNPFDTTGNRTANFIDNSAAGLGSVLGQGFQNIGMNLGLAFLNDIQATLLIRAAQNSTQAEVLASPRLTVFNTQRGNVSVGQSYAYIQDADVGNQGALDPEVGTVTTRTSLDVRPIVSADRRFVYLELFPEVLRLQPPAGTQGGPFRRIPIQAVAATNNNVVVSTMSIELPQQVFQIVETTVCVPDRGHLLVGGLADVTHREVESGVPILNKIPLIKRLFSRHSTIEQKQHLLILVHPTILAQDELEDHVY
ncbi:MAG: hypothetical protein GXP25_00380 [Planctomycetes bacterium]|nr:hypothetical protein [Planctomycetota bacterium]